MAVCVGGPKYLSLLLGSVLNRIWPAAVSLSCRHTLDSVEPSLQGAPPAYLPGRERALQGHCSVGCQPSAQSSMKNGILLQRNETQMQHLGHLDGLGLSLDAEAMAGSMEDSEIIMRSQSFDSTIKPYVTRSPKPAVIASCNNAGCRELMVNCKNDGKSDEELDSSENVLSTSLMELSVLQKLGLHRASLTEQEVEAAFAYLALSFRCDMFTLRQRIEIEERARNTAEENIQQELVECRAMLQKLDQICLDTRQKELIEHLQNSLTVLAGAIERATAAAEKLGAVHQESRMSRAAEVMVQHVENLKRHHLREHSELEDMKRLIQQNSRNRQLAENRDDGEQRLKYPLTRMFQQGSARRRVSIAVVPRQLTQFHSPVDGPGCEEEAVKPTGVKGGNPESQSGFLQEDPAENDFILHAGLSNFSQQSLQGTQSSVYSNESRPCGEWRDSELRSRSTNGRSIQETSEVLSNEEANEKCGVLEENVLLTKRSNLELCRAWFSMPTYYWSLLWVFLLGIVCLVLIRILELQKQYPFTASDC